MLRVNITYSLKKKAKLKNPTAKKGHWPRKGCRQRTNPPGCSAVQLDWGCWAIYGLSCSAWGRSAGSSRRWGRKDERTVRFISGCSGRKLSTILFSSSPSDVNSSIRKASSWGTRNGPLESLPSNSPGRELVAKGKRLFSGKKIEPKVAPRLLAEGF